MRESPCRCRYIIISRASARNIIVHACALTWPLRARARKGWCRVCYGAAEMKHHKHNVSQLLAAANPGRKRSEASI